MNSPLQIKHLDAIAKAIKRLFKLYLNKQYFVLLMHYISSIVSYGNQTVGRQIKHHDVIAKTIKWLFKLHLNKQYFFLSMHYKYYLL